MIFFYDFVEKQIEESLQEKMDTWIDQHLVLIKKTFYDDKYICHTYVPKKETVVLGNILITSSCMVNFFLQINLYDSVRNETIPLAYVDNKDFFLTLNDFSYIRNDYIRFKEEWNKLYRKKEKIYVLELLRKKKNI